MGTVNRLAQVFDINGEYLPTKASILIKPHILTKNVAYFNLNSDITIDSLNFSSLERNSENYIIPNDLVDGYTGKGYVDASASNSSYDMTMIKYPVRGSVDLYKIWFRGAFYNNSVIEVYVDDVLMSSVDDLGNSSSSSGEEVSWNWIDAYFNLVDDETHIIGIKIRGILLDKLYITTSNTIPTNDGPAYSSSPYLTLHGQIYSVDETNAPVNPLTIHDYKTTIEDIKEDGWYNFDLNSISSSSITFEDKHAFVVFSVGGDSSNYLLWENYANDEDINTTAFIKY